MPHSRMSYAKAGVNRTQISATHAALAKKLASTFRTRKGRLGEPIFPIGHYAGLVDIGDGKILSLHTDSVGSKVIIAQLMRKYDTIGIDCVAMCANDLICTGSEPISFLDYLAISRPNPQVSAKVADGIVEGAKQAGMAVVGGETAVVPDLLSSGPGGGMDLVGMGAGICSKDHLVLGDKIEKGDAIIGVASSGIHSNGLTLARKILLKRHSLREEIPELGRSLGEELLEPTRIYVKPVLDALRNIEIHGLAHITGGGFSKLNRIVSQAKLGASLEDLPPLPQVFRLIQKEGHVENLEMYRTFNMGIGLVTFCPEQSSDSLVRTFKKHNQKAFSLGRVTQERGVRVEGIHVAA
jgi:phosphoribosylformylglycinamidine cyclo-ligase